MCIYCEHLVDCNLWPYLLSSDIQDDVRTWRKAAYFIVRVTFVFMAPAHVTVLVVVCYTQASNTSSYTTARCTGEVALMLTVLKFPRDKHIDTVQAL